MDVIPHIIAYFLNTSFRRKNVTAIFMLKQKQSSVAMLKNWYKTATLTYEPQVREYESSLLQQRFSKISISKNVILENMTGIVPLGWFPKRILRRLRCTEQTGIVD